MRDGNLFWIVIAILGIALLALLTSQDGMIAGLPDGQFAELAYYGTWGVALAAGLFLFSGIRIGEAFRYALVWIGLFIVVIGAYAFAPEFLAIKDRITAVLMPGSVVSIANDSERPQYMATRGRDGHFHLNGTVDGEDVSFMVDTGASVIAMDRPTAESIGIETGRLSFSDYVQTANGIVRSAPVFLDSVTVGDIERRNIRAAVTDGDGLGTVLLGMSFLDTLTSYDFRGDRLVLTD
ncbi:Eukaryotic/viral aspartic protease, active site [Fulvimarina pelagi HTCC2506]|uniref:Eukaryotic/viral aspartic protease, active site n=2 Tax=Fulvimarina pelagi TaxID=217511 RepID=Q0FZJ6_9HYPH|nr:TIGR02281 family clan AA aspartic protease [Fulvimarina pelagi]EAU40282.1 Eukaryotic/viral aspartic protease, active site [Fulvimarina pelagi HTCC2506]BAT31322.1 eukaryotic/viral aspartic protease, active site [Fulvimarina pelagi]